MFNRRDSGNPSADNERSAALGAASSKNSSGAFIGPTIQIEGTITSKEDLLIEGEVRGNVHLKSNRLMIGKAGRVFADVHAKTVCVEGQVDGHLVVKELLEILSTARIRGTITAPRISLKDGARFNGTIDMDPEAKALKTAFDRADASAADSPQSGGSSGDSGDAVDSSDQN